MTIRVSIKDQFGYSLSFTIIQHISATGVQSKSAAIKWRQIELVQVIPRKQIGVKTSMNAQIIRTNATVKLAIPRGSSIVKQMYNSDRGPITKTSIFVIIRIRRHDLMIPFSLIFDFMPSSRLIFGFFPISVNFSWSNPVLISAFKKFLRTKRCNPVRIRI